MIDESTGFGARVAGHLREEILVWLTTSLASAASSHGDVPPRTRRARVRATFHGVVDRDARQVDGRQRSLA
jgi:hypothetical protein